MKKLFIACAALAVLLVVTSCSSYTCPTYARSTSGHASLHQRTSQPL